MKKRLIPLLLCIAMFLTLAVGCSANEPADTSKPADSGKPADTSAPAETTGRTEPITLKFGSVGSGSEFDELSYACLAFIEAVERDTNGMVKIEFYPNGELGSEASMLEQIMTGSLDFACISGGVCATVWPDFGVYALPFAFESIDSFWEIDRAGAFDYLETMTREENKGAITMGSFACTFRGFSNKIGPVRTTDDVKGLQTRVPVGEIYTDIFSAIGCNPATVAYAELYSALQQGVVDAEDNGIVTDYDRKFWEIEKYHTQLNMIPQINALIVSTDTLDKLSDAEIEIIRNAIDEAERNHQTSVNALIGECAGYLEDEGVDVIMRDELTDAEVKTFTDALQPVWDKYAAALDADFYNNFMEIRASVQG